jgi:hypothetical protein
MRSGAPARKPRTANGGRGEMRSGTDWLPKPSLLLWKISKTITHSKRPSSGITTLRTAVERELVLRLASLLWRIRRATAIETDLLQIQAEILSDRRLECATGDDAEGKPQGLVCSVSQRAIGPSLRRHSGNGSSHYDQGVSNDDPCDPLEAPRDDPSGISRNLTYCFLRLANLDNGVFERLRRYEAALWRQIVQTPFALRTVRHRSR